MAITHDALDLTIQGPPAPSPSIQGPTLAHSRSVQEPPGSPSVQDPPCPLALTPGSDIWWPRLEDLFKLVNLRTPLLLVTSFGQDWGPVQTCSLENPSPAGDIW